MYMIEETEVKGLSLKNTIEGCGAFKRMAYNLLEERGAKDIQEEEWYSLKSFLSILDEIAEKAGPNLLVQIGKNIRNNSVFPPEVKTYEQALLLMDVAYKMHHRKGDIGSYSVVKEGEKTIRMICDNPYPAKMNYGLLRGLAEKFDTFADIEELDMSGGGEFLIKL